MLGLITHHEANGVNMHTDILVKEIFKVWQNTDHVHPEKLTPI
jgi:hypothetical protein